MDRAIFDRMAENDHTHWWFVSRRRILASIIARRAKLPQDARILEIGCGTGHNFGMLGSFGNVDAIEIDDIARRIASERLGKPVSNAPLPDLPGIEDKSYDLIALLDVLEHIEDDRSALLTIKQKLRPGGKILATVPANKWMWSEHDLAHHHFRRYSAGSLSAIAKSAGLEIHLLSHFNTLLFPLAAVSRLWSKISKQPVSGDTQPSAPLNGFFKLVFGLERHAVGRLPMPYGVSLVSIMS